MSRDRHGKRVCFTLLLLISISFAHAETGKVLVQVEDTKRQPVKGIEIAIEGGGGSKLTGNDGKAQLSVAADTLENDWISLQIVHSPPGKDLVIVSPWDYRAQVPSFKDRAENFIRVVVARRGDRGALENGSVLAALAAQINKANTPTSTELPSRRKDPEANLGAVAKQYGLTANEIDQAIRA